MHLLLRQEEIDYGNVNNNFYITHFEQLMHEYNQEDDGQFQRLLVKLSFKVGAMSQVYKFARYLQRQIEGFIFMVEILFDRYLKKYAHERGVAVFIIYLYIVRHRTSESKKQKIAEVYNKIKGKISDCSRLFLDVIGWLDQTLYIQEETLNLLQYVFQDINQLKQPLKGRTIIEAKLRFGQSITKRAKREDQRCTVDILHDNLKFLQSIEIDQRESEFYSMKFIQKFKCYFLLGDIDQMLKIKKCLEQLQDLKQQYIAFCLGAIGSIYYHRNILFEAIEYFQQSLKIVEENEVFVFRLSDCYYQVCDYENCIRCLKVYVNIQYLTYQRISQGYARLGSAVYYSYIEQQQINRDFLNRQRVFLLSVAQDYCQKSRKINNSNYLANQTLGLIQLYQNNYYEAKQRFSQMMNDFGEKHRNRLKNLLKYSMKLQQIYETEGIYISFRERNFFNYWSFEQMIQLISAKTKQALKQKQYLRGIYIYYKQLGNRAMKCNKIDLALKNFEFVLKNNPNNVEIKLIISDLYRQKREYGIALSHLNDIKSQFDHFMVSVQDKKQMMVKILQLYRLKLQHLNNQELVIFEEDIDILKKLFIQTLELNKYSPIPVIFNQIQQEKIQEIYNFFLPTNFQQFYIRAVSKIYQRQYSKIDINKQWQLSSVNIQIKNIFCNMKKAVYNELEQSHQEAKISFIQGKILFQCKNYTKCKQLMTRFLNRCKKDENIFLKQIQQVNSILIEMLMKSQFAYQQFNQIMSMINPDILNCYKSLQSLGILYFEYGCFEKSVYYLWKSFDMNKQKKVLVHLTNSYKKLAFCNYDEEFHHSSIARLIEEYKIFLTDQDDYSNLIQLSRIINDPDRIIKSYFDLIDYLNKNKKQILIVQKELRDYYLQHNFNEKAKEFAVSALIAKPNKENIKILQSTLTGQIGSQEKLQQISTLLIKKMGQKHEELPIIMNIISIFYQNQRQAISWFRRALKFIVDVTNTQQRNNKILKFQENFKITQQSICVFFQRTILNSIPSILGECNLPFDKKSEVFFQTIKKQIGGSKEKNFIDEKQVTELERVFLSKLDKESKIFAINFIMFHIFRKNKEIKTQNVNNLFKLQFLYLQIDAIDHKQNFRFYL